MTDAFATLNLPHRATLTEEEVRAAYFSLSKSEGADHAELNAAYETLLAPEKRLRHLLDLDAPNDRQWKTVTMPEDMMETFMALGRLRPEAEALIEKRAKGQSALSKALLEPQTFALRDQIETVGTALDERRTALESTLVDEMTWESISAAQARFAYLGKWQTQVRELLLKLM